MHLEWHTVYGPNRQPTEAETEAFVSTPLWADIHRFVREQYAVESNYSYSSCSGQPGWNVKYQKAGRALCTLYPMPGFFIALVVIGAKERSEAELIMPTCSPRTQALFAQTRVVMGGQWLMIPVTDEAVLEDVKQLIQVRRKIKMATHV